ncbi:hypothetical protein CR513_57887, partial [Mucuna pruriens]
MVIIVEVANFVVKKLVGFLSERVDTRGYIDLLTTFNNEKTMRTIFVRYLVIIVETSDNILISRPMLNALGTIVSMPHLVMKFSFSNHRIMNI